MSKGTELGKKAQEYVNSGTLVPNEITIGMILERISEPDAKKGFMLDGFPRTMEQANALDEALTNRDGAIDRAVYIKVAPEELVRRLAGRWSCPGCGAVYHELNHPPKQAQVCDNCSSSLTQREDDRPDVVRKRIDLQMEGLEPLLAHYRRQGKLSEIDGERDADAVTREIQQLLKPVEA
jgi:adenylate kinase